jgi:hypothetical protein
MLLFLSCYVRGICSWAGMCESPYDSGLSFGLLTSDWA